MNYSNPSVRTDILSKKVIMSVRHDNSQRTHLQWTLASKVCGFRVDWNPDNLLVIVMDQSTFDLGLICCM